MQWTLRTMLSAAAIVAYLIAGISTFGIIATATSLLIGTAAGFYYSRCPLLHNRKAQVAYVFGTVLLVYVSTFGVFRLARTFPCSIAGPGDPWENIVVFSFDPNAQQVARNVYYPLITVASGHCAYPTDEELRRLLRAFPMGRYEYIW